MAEVAGLYQDARQDLPEGVLAAEVVGDPLAPLFSEELQLEASPFALCSQQGHEGPSFGPLPLQVPHDPSLHCLLEVALLHLQEEPPPEWAFSEEHLGVGEGGLLLAEDGELLRTGEGGDGLVLEEGGVDEGFPLLVYF